MIRKGLAVIALSTLAFLGIYAALHQNKPYSQRIVIFAGSASKPALEEAASLFEEKTGVKVELHFGGSGNMLSQLEISRAGDVYMPGSQDYMFKAVEKGLVHPETIRKIAYLIPAIIVQRGNPKNISSLEDLSREGLKIGIADPDSVCVGQYAVEILKVNNLYGRISKNIVVMAESCSKVASLVVLRQVDAVIGWRIFHYWNPSETDIVYIAPEKIPRIAYIPAAVSSFTENKDLASRFIKFLTSEEAREIFRIHGYILSEAEAKVYAPSAVIPEG